MSVQLENGFTKIAHELLETIPFYKFNGTQFSILIVIIRYTYGFNRKDHELSLTYLTKATGIKRSQIDRELTLLIDKKVVAVTQEPTATVSRKLALNKHYDQWLIDRRYPLIRGQSPKQSIPELGSKVSPNQGTEGIPYLEDKDIKSSFKDIKDTTTDDFDKVRFAYREMHGVIDLPLQDSPMLTKLLQDGIKPELIIDVMKEKQKQGVKTIKYYVEAIRERHEGKPTTRKRNEPDWDKILKQMEDAEHGSRTSA